MKCNSKENSKEEKKSKVKILFKVLLKAVKGLLLLLLIFNLGLISSSYFSKAKLPMFLGCTMAIVGSDYMNPLVKSGDLIFVVEQNHEKLQAGDNGDIILFNQDDNIMISRLVDIQKGFNDKTSYVTKSNNIENESMVITDEMILGKYVFNLSFMLPVLHIMSLDISQVFLLIVLSLSILILVRRWIKKFKIIRKNKK